MSARSERLARQAVFESEFNTDMQARPNLEPRPAPVAESPDYCGPNMRGHRHSFWTSKQDGKRRCYYCCCIREDAR